MKQVARRNQSRRGSKGCENTFYNHQSETELNSTKQRDQVKKNMEWLDQMAPLLGQQRKNTSWSTKKKEDGKPTEYQEELDCNDSQASLP